ncbi:MAG: alpha/beta fold hydrolase [Niabella sp.]
MKYFFLLLISLSGKYLNAQPITGTWQGTLEAQGFKLPVLFHIKQEGASLISTMDSPAQGAKGIKTDTTVFTNEELKITINIIKAGYMGKLTRTDSIAGTFTQFGNSLPLGLKKSKDSIYKINRPQTPVPPFNYNIEDVTIKNDLQGNTLAGTLTTPFNKKDFPLVIMITGSGSQDRDETIFGHKPFWVIADFFANHGIGVLRMDDRGVGGSEKGKDNTTSADFATDINSAVNFLAKRGYKNIGLAGHSEGGMIAPIAASQNKNIKFVVLMAAPGIPIDELMLIQNSLIGKTSGLSSEQVDQNIARTKDLYQFIKNYTGNDLKDALRKKATLYFEKDTQTTAAQQQAVIEQQVAVVSSPWFVYFIKFIPDSYIQKLNIPVLAINGSKDVQVAAKENLEGIKKSLQKAGNKNFEVAELKGLNHLFQEAGTGAVSEYATIEQTIAPDVLVLMKNWILKNAIH